MFQLPDFLVVYDLVTKENVEAAERKKKEYIEQNQALIIEQNSIRDQELRKVN